MTDVSVFTDTGALFDLWDDTIAVWIVPCDGGISCTAWLCTRAWSAWEAGQNTGVQPAGSDFAPGVEPDGGL